MADTIITNTPNPRNNESDAGWGVPLVIILLVMVAGIAFLYRAEIFQTANPTDSAETTNINVSVPTPQTSPVIE